MTERPILFSAPMIRALLAGTKTQTRRVVKPQPQPNGGAGLSPVAPYKNSQGNWAWVLAATGHGSGGNLFACPYGQPGDRLWVREAWRTTGDDGRCDDMPPRDLQPHSVWYEANGMAPRDECTGKLRPSMFMPRWASRILLEVTGVRVERLQAISEADCWAEGIERSKESPTQASTIFSDYASPRTAYMHLWESINGPGSWDANPWVWAVSFRRLKP
jgi:hypothetical protein